jgi:hypothetical protein
LLQPTNEPATIALPINMRAKGFFIVFFSF